MVLWVPIFVTLCMRAMMMLWNAFMFLGLRHVGVSPLSSFLLWVLCSLYFIEADTCLIPEIAGKRFD
jgi:hypothetical protein